MRPDCLAGCPRASRETSGVAWANLNDQKKAYEAEIMAVHAAMVDCLDQGVGRVMDKLRETREFENTIIFFFADNGASPERGYPPGFDRNGDKRDGTPVNYKASTNLGSEGTYPYLGRPWSNAVNSPFRYWKKESYEGGCHTPMIVHWPAGLKTDAGSVTHQVGHVMDVMPTCLELAGAEYPREYERRGNSWKIVPMDGKSLLPILRGKGRAGHDSIFFEHSRGRAARIGDWKISADVWSVTSFTELRRNGLSVERENRYNPEADPKLSWVEQCLNETSGPVTAVGSSSR